ncbi:MAG: hypothetical protein NW223_02645 [Hyphomicrobiaceae bacterium]|nr:hypothetical protein [Hyphomicrobiaceae bacterium]
MPPALPIAATPRAGLAGGAKPARVAKIADVLQLCVAGRVRPGTIADCNMFQWIARLARRAASARDPLREVRASPAGTRVNQFFTRIDAL